MKRVERVTADMLRKMRVGDSIDFKLPSAGALLSARSTAYRLKLLKQGLFRTSSPKDGVITITRIS